jgi:hypothetical protein
MRVLPPVLRLFLFSLLAFLLSGAGVAFSPASVRAAVPLPLPRLLDTCSSRVENCSYAAARTEMDGSAGPAQASMQPQEVNADQQDGQEEAFQWIWVTPAAGALIFLAGLLLARSFRRRG